MERNCPMTAFDDGKPPWCGVCDQRTRLSLDGDGKAQRCPVCHPLRREHLKQLSRCPACRMLVYAWDSAPCGQHTAPTAPDRKPDIEHVREITRRTA